MIFSPFLYRQTIFQKALKFGILRLHRKQNWLHSGPFMKSDAFKLRRMKSQGFLIKKPWNRIEFSSFQQKQRNFQEMLPKLAFELNFRCDSPRKAGWERTTDCNSRYKTFIDKWKTVFDISNHFENHAWQFHGLSLKMSPYMCQKVSLYSAGR